MGEYRGTIYDGSQGLQTSGSGVEILSYSYRDFELINYQDCHIAINGGDYIYVKANQGILIYVANSIKFQESGVTFNWMGTRS